MEAGISSAILRFVALLIFVGFLLAVGILFVFFTGQTREFCLFDERANSLRR
ncbi:MAG: hypothetical protein HY508_15920 [Acidobacteria bacterium]|nr:hypothetical protein [Acidobacteriota bacterium]